jgi:hypothetical protein
MSADIHLDNIHAAIGLSGALDFHLDDIAQALTTGVKISAGLDNIRVTELPEVRVSAAVTQLPEVRVSAAITELPVIRTDSKIDAGLDNIRIQELPPIKLEFSFRPIRIHLPLNYSFSIELLGFRLFKFSLCGEGMAITEDYQPHTTESCR